MVINVRKSYLSNYVRVYLWQCLSIVTSFLSMFVVMPLLSSRPAMFGIYSICMSITVFVSYADMGFMSSGFRYASDSFVKGDLAREARIVGFVSFILLAFVMVHAVVVSVLAIYPTLLIADLSDPQESWTASVLLALLAAFSPVIVLQRILQIIFGVRIEDYIYQRINIAGNVAKIASVFLFFDASGYNIAGYFFTGQLINLLGSAASLIVAKRRYHYDLGLLLRSIRFSRDIYDATRRLAFSSLYVTLAWVVFYEFDTLFIGKTLGAERLAFYSVALALATFFRTLSAIVFTPFRARINHLVALNDEPGVRELYRRVMVVTLPASMFPVISLIVLMKPFVSTWVGDRYLPSVLIAQMLIFAYVDGFSGNPAAYLLTAQERVRELNLIGSVPPIVLWGSVVLTIHLLDVTMFGFFKFAATLPVQLFGLVISARCLKMTGAEFFNRILSPAILPSAFLTVLLFWLKDLMPLEKNPVNVAAVVATGAAASALALLIYYWRSSEFRAAVLAVMGSDLFRRKEIAVGL